MDPRCGTHLVLKIDLDLLLGRGDDMLFGRTLESGKLGHRLVDNVQGLLDLLLGDDQWWGKANDVLVGGLGL